MLGKGGFVLGRHAREVDSRTQIFSRQLSQQHRRPEKSRVKLIQTWAVFTYGSYVYYKTNKQTNKHDFLRYSGRGAETPSASPEVVQARLPFVAKLSKHAWSRKRPRAQIYVALPAPLAPNTFFKHDNSR